ncbi:hypothetical protein [Clostridium sp. DJ247]|uniref:hypothetical protein n=1 Tax=Clostridium sp. DJ247 TaxID=2726188 RepID=UPI0016267A34|nr:hypothetical protein [Clostridium sp. DJ247]MBC2581328.1 hypothetical protein [Clostridium sp. DJ247]
MTENRNNKQKKNKYINNLFNSIENYISKGKEEELRDKISSIIREKIFSKDIEECLNFRDFSDVGFLDNSVENVAFLFSTMFPVFIEERGVTFRLYKHKIEITLSDKMKDRFIYIFSEGSLISGEFKCYRLYNDEYVYIVKRIIEIIPKLKDAIKEAINNFDGSSKDIHVKKENSKIHLDKAKHSAKLLLDML